MLARVRYIARVGRLTAANRHDALRFGLWNARRVFRRELEGLGWLFVLGVPPRSRVLVRLDGRTAADLEDLLLAGRTHKREAALEPRSAE